MSRREYPRIVQIHRNPRWTARPDQAPMCIVAGCKDRATHRPDIQVNWFRGDDLSSGPCCKVHASGDPHVLIEATAEWRRRNRETQEAAEARGAARRAAAAAAAKAAGL